MAEKKTVEKVPEGQARFFKTRQMEPNEKGFVGFETVWEPFQKEVEYETPKKALTGPARASVPVQAIVWHRSISN